MRRGFTLLELLVVVLIIAVLFGMLTGGGAWLGQALWYLVAGWVYFIGRKVPRAEPTAEAVLTALVGLLLLVLLVHFLMRRFYDRPAGEGAPGRRWAFRRTAAVVGVIVLTFAAGISAVGITHQTAWLSTTDELRLERRERPSHVAAIQFRSQNNLKEFGIVAHSFHEAKKTLPPAMSFDTHGRVLHGWPTHLLPYLEQEDLYKKIDLGKPWDHDVNREPMRQLLKMYRHPAHRQDFDADGYALTNYAANVHAFAGDRPPRLEDFTRGTSNTILYGEANGNFKPWGYPLNVRDPRLGLQRSPDGFGGPMKGRTQFVMADGSVRTLTNDADPEFLEMLAHPGGR